MKYEAKPNYLIPDYSLIINKEGVPVRKIGFNIFVEAHTYPNPLQVLLRSYSQRQKWSFETCFMNNFWKENIWMKALGHPRRPIENSTTESTASKNYVHKKIILRMFIQYIQRQIVSGWSRYSWTPSTASTSSTIANTANTSYVHQRLTWGMFNVLYLLFFKNIDLKWSKGEPGEQGALGH